jgi:predicted alpha/beta superfamily hydrolase
MEPSVRGFSLFNTREHAVHSARINQGFRIGVWLPFSYAQSERRYPAVYLTDGEYTFGAATGLIPTMIGNGEMPEALIVGIAYEGITDYAGFGALRDVDLLPDGISSAPSRMEGFTRFIAEELVPMIEAAYRCDGRRCLYGFSAGGFFAYHMMLNHPGTFGAYVAASCTWPGAGERIVGYLKKYADAPTRPAVRVFHATGELEHEQGAGSDMVAEAIGSGACPEIDFTFQRLAGEGHSSSVIAQSMIMGLRRVFR